MHDRIKLRTWLTSHALEDHPVVIFFRIDLAERMGTKKAAIYTRVSALDQHPEMQELASRIWPHGSRNLWTCLETKGS
jgi:hypothetical protein